MLTGNSLSLCENVFTSTPAAWPVEHLPRSRDRLRRAACCAAAGKHAGNNRTAASEIEEWLHS